MKKVLIILGIVLILIQFVRPSKNNSNDQTAALSQKYHVPAGVQQALEVACYDCHSNKTNYPWYSNVQPFAWFLDHHVTDGKKHLNFSVFLKYSAARQKHKLEETIEEVKEDEMPLASYTYFGLHKDANLTEAQRKLIIDWAEAQIDTLKANYPADSLVRKGKKTS